MCTATWIRIEGGYELFFNRDELKARKPGLPPTPRERGGVRFLAPTDGDAGGAWLGVNDRGISVGIANGPRSERDEGSGPFRSRGLLVLDLLACASIDEIGRSMRSEDPARYRSFALLALAPARDAVVFDWDGTRLEVERRREAGALLISSSRDPARAREARRAELERLVRERGVLDRDLLLDFHASHAPERGPFSPCMHREDAGTVSFSRIHVSAARIELEYRPGPPCEGAPAIRTSLGRAV